MRQQLRREVTAVSLVSDASPGWESAVFEVMSLAIDGATTDAERDEHHTCLTELVAKAARSARREAEP
jgi:5-deoxy-D-glucuronate isomerase